MKIPDTKIVPLPFDELQIELETLKLEVTKTLEAHKSFYNKQFKKFRIQFPASNQFLKITKENVRVLESSNKYMT